LLPFGVARQQLRGRVATRGKKEKKGGSKGCLEHSRCQIARNVLKREKGRREPAALRTATRPKGGRGKEKKKERKKGAPFRFLRAGKKERPLLFLEGKDACEKESFASIRKKEWGNNPLLVAEGRKRSNFPARARWPGRGAFQEGGKKKKKKEGNGGPAET